MKCFSLVKTVCAAFIACATALTAGNLHAADTMTITSAMADPGTQGVTSSIVQLVIFFLRTNLLLQKGSIGPETSPTSGQTQDGCIMQLWSICSVDGWSVGHSVASAIVS